jgi:hypothetical protein
MERLFYYQLDIAVNAITKKGKNLAGDEKKIQEWIRFYIPMLTEIEKYLLDLKTFVDSSLAEDFLKRLKEYKKKNTYEELKKFLEDIRDNLAEVYRKHFQIA